MTLVLQFPAVFKFIRKITKVLTKYLHLNVYLRQRIPLKIYFNALNYDICFKSLRYLFDVCKFSFI